MAMVGCFGEVVFRVEEDEVETFDNVEWAGEARYAVHQRHLQNALTEFTGVEPDKIAFEVTLSEALGINVMGELVKLWAYEREGTALPLVLGTRPMGKYRWNLIKHTIQYKNYDADGNVVHAVASLELREYLRNWE